MKSFIQQHKTSEEQQEDSDTIIMEKGLMAAIRKFLGSRLVWRGVITILVSAGIFQREMPSKIDVTNAQPITQQVSKEDFQKLTETVGEIKSSLGSLNDRVFYLSGRIEGLSLRSFKPSSSIATNRPYNMYE